MLAACGLAFALSRKRQNFYNIAYPTLRRCRASRCWRDADGLPARALVFDAAQRSASTAFGPSLPGSGLLSLRFGPNRHRCHRVGHA